MADDEKVLHLEGGQLWVLRSPAERYNDAVRAAVEAYEAYQRKIRGEIR